MAARISLREYQRDLVDRLQKAGTARVASKLGLQVAGGRWLVDLTDAGEVIPVPAITPVPLTRPWFKGVANVRGNLVSVVDFGAFVGAGAVAPAEQSRLLLLHERLRMGCGLLVERSLGLYHPEQLQERAAAASRAPWIRAEYEDAQGAHWRELDLPQLAQDPEFLGVGA